MESSLLDQSPNFNSYSCDMLAEIAAKGINDEPQQQEQNEDVVHEDDDDEDDNEDDFEFAVVGNDSNLSPIPTDKIFDNGHIGRFSPFSTVLCSSPMAQSPIPNQTITLRVLLPPKINSKASRMKFLVSQTEIYNI
ncbi:hypothetical protein NE237_022218 [Protea cynaroides]|uniref:Uncharacterized protein n=1 Tax=Protea cynaroides TaxID=273540 RepID=A0A9Q0HAL4_9MAGN|nr:hypothetical protein NE237_022218 [Protea cynaroides]